MTINGRHPREDLAAMCDPCVAGKQARAPFPTSSTRTAKPLELVHTDVCGPMPLNSMGNSRYFLTVVEDMSEYREAVPIPSKSEAGRAVRDVIARWEVRTGHKVQRWRFDRGGECMNETMDKWTADRGTIHETTAPYTPEQNGKAERANRTILEKVSAIIAAAGCDKNLWAEAVSTTTHVLNRVPRAGASKTPHDLWNGVRPSVDHLRTFGCRAVVLTPAKMRRKLEARGQPGIFIGYEDGAKAYRVLVNNTVKISRNVLCDESRMGIADDKNDKAWDVDVQKHVTWANGWMSTETPPSGHTEAATSDGLDQAETPSHTAAQPAPTDDLLASLRLAATMAGTLPSPESIAERQAPATSITPAATAPPPSAGTRRSTRDRLSPARLGTWIPHDYYGEGSGPSATRAATAATGSGATTDAADNGDAVIAAGDKPVEAAGGTD